MTPPIDGPVVVKKRRPRVRPPPGAAPGTLIIDPNAPPPAITVFAYGPEGYAEKKIKQVGDIAAYLNKWPVTWVNVDGLGDAEILEQLADIFCIHVLALEDIIYVHQRAKVEAYRDNQFIVARMVSLGKKVETEQVSFFLGTNYVLTFQERAGDCFNPVRERIRKGGHRIRSTGADYLAYALLDSIVDAYYPLLEQYGERLDALQDVVITKPGKNTILLIHDVRRDLRVLRRAIWPLREVFNTLCRDPLPLITDDTRLFFRDCYDHTIQVVELVETYREIGSDLSDLYLSSISNRMNEVMRVLTIIATIFIPLTFIAGVYGMNFDPETSPWNMPELRWYMGYPFSILLMILSAFGMLFFFWRKGWIGSRNLHSTDNEEEIDDARTAGTGNHKKPVE